jgi:hypothetical protein
MDELPSHHAKFMLKDSQYIYAQKSLNFWAPEVLGDFNAQVRIFSFIVNNILDFVLCFERQIA